MLSKLRPSPVRVKSLPAAQCAVHGRVPRRVCLTLRLRAQRQNLATTAGSGAVRSRSILSAGRLACNRLRRAKRDRHSARFPPSLRSLHRRERAGRVKGAKRRSGPLTRPSRGPRRAFPSALGWKRSRTINSRSDGWIQPRLSLFMTTCVRTPVWSYPDPIDGAPPLAGLLAFYFDAVDEWWEEGEGIGVHARHSYHRCDVAPLGPACGRARRRRDGRGQHMPHDAVRDWSAAALLPAGGRRGDALPPSNRHGDPVPRANATGSAAARSAVRCNRMLD
jgi:hypothetical protein